MKLFLLVCRAFVPPKVSLCCRSCTPCPPHPLSHCETGRRAPIHSHRQSSQKRGFSTRSTRSTRRGSTWLRKVTTKKKRGTLASESNLSRRLSISFWNCTSLPLAFSFPSKAYCFFPSAAYIVRVGSHDTHRRFSLTLELESAAESTTASIVSSCTRAKGSLPCVRLAEQVQVQIDGLSPTHLPSSGHERVEIWPRFGRA